jgi:hypothetical protein
MLRDAINELLRKTDSRNTNDKIDLHIFDKSIGYVDDIQKFLTRVNTNVKVDSDFFRPFIHLLKEKRLIELLELNFKKDTKGAPLIQTQ